MAHFSRTSNSFYAIRLEWIKEEKKCRRIAMAREILDCQKGMVVDHINHDTLDNRRSNIRLATRAQNGYNRKLNKNNTSGMKGVSWDKRRNKWATSIKEKGKLKWLGYFPSRELAGITWRNQAAKLQGEFFNKI